MGKRPRINSTIRIVDNTNYIACLKTVEQQIEQLYMLTKKRSDKKYEAEKDLLKTLDHVKSYNINLGNELLKNSTSLKNHKVFPYNFITFHNKIRQNIYFEQSQKLTSLIAANNLSPTPEGEKKIKDYINSLSDKELYGSLRAAIAKFTENPDDTLLYKTNVLLRPFHKQIVREKYHSKIEGQNSNRQDWNERVVTRADFNGGFYTIPGKDLELHNPYSKAYRDFTSNSKRQKMFAPKAYDLTQCPSWQTCKKSPNFTKLEPYFIQSLSKLSIPPAILPKLNAADIMDIMTPDRYAHHTGAYFISFKSLNKECSRGARQEFLDMLDKQQLQTAIASICKAPHTYKQIHHQYPISNFGHNANDILQYTIMVTDIPPSEQQRRKNELDYSEIHNFLHAADMTLRRNPKKILQQDPSYFKLSLSDRQNGDTMFYMIDTRAEQCRNNNQVMLLSGLREEQFTTIDLPPPPNKLYSKKQSKGATR